MTTPTPRLLPLSLPVSLLLAMSAAPAALAEPAEGTRDAAAIEAAAGVGSSRFGLTSGGEVRTRLGATTLGATVALRRGPWYPAGLPTEDVTTTDVRLGARRTVLDDGRVALELAAAAGVRALTADTTRFGFGLELGADAVVRAAPGVRVRVGLSNPLAVVGGEIDQLDQRLHAGLELRVAPTLWLVADAYAGGAYGYDGDGAKLDAGATIGMRYAHIDDRIAGDDTRPGIGAFLATEYRALALAEHASHGPGFAAGVTLLDGHLRLGLAGFNRPGPINTRTFPTMPVDGQAWNGRTQVPLRGDGNFVGLHVAPSVRIGRAHLELPVTVGQAAFGFYLHGEDRDAVMGERVSAAENRLFGGKDSSFAFGAEAGLRVAYEVRPWLRPYAAVRYLTTVGYDTIVTADYSGASGALGLELVP